MIRFKTLTLQIFGCIAVCLVLLGSKSAADTKTTIGPSVIKRLENGIQIETHWGQTLYIGLSSDAARKDDWLKLPLGHKNVRFGQELDHAFDRAVNQEEFVWGPSDGKHSENALRVRSIGSSVIVVEAAGVTIQLVEFSGDRSVGEYSQCDVLVACGDFLAAQPELGLIAKSSSAKKIVIAGDMKSLKAGTITPIVADATTTVSLSSHNATSATFSDKGLLLVGLSNKPWEMPEEMATLFDKMETSCQKSQEVFGKLSVEQLNFKPANGTHTPRWNCEHMMGRQLGFFSQIYHAIDPTIPIMDLNPKQMPPDYEFAHPEWSGLEEAAQMQRVSDFTRRFAYLLDGQEVAKRAPGSRWPSLGALLRQMERHYDEHTANTVKKFELPGWPTK